jgi:predicted Zn-dependent protease
VTLSPRLSLLAGVVVLALVACQKVPITGRPQFNLVPDSIMRGIGKSSYQSVLGEERVKRSGEDVEVLERVGRRISKVANEPDYDWTYTMVEKDELNAWCMPGGYITFYTGILPVLKHEAGMAFVMGHEVGHATAHHGAERLSQQLALIGGLAGLELYMANATEMKPKERAIILAALGVGAEVGVLLPFSRTHESEADRPASRPSCGIAWSAPAAPRSRRSSRRTRATRTASRTCASGCRARARSSSGTRCPWRR